MNGISREDCDFLLAKYLPPEEGRASRLIQAMNYSVRAGGKRLRPRMMYAMYVLCGGTEKVVEPFMAAIEMIHSYSLVHDDLPCMDNDTLRRGHPTTWSVYGEDFAVLAGDGLLTYAFETAVKGLTLTEHPERAARAVGILAQKAGIYGMAGGQSVDVAMTGRPLDAETLDYICRLKTGALIQASLKIGAVLAGAPEELEEKAEKIGGCIGMAFQIRDDVLDVISDEATLGKNIGSDARNRKTTYATLYGLDAAERKIEEETESARAILERFPGDTAYFRDLIGQMKTRRN